MTTAHRPTWNPAKGGNEQGGFRLNVPSAKVSARDMPGHLHLKERGKGQGAPEDLEGRDLKRELEEKEQQHRKKTKIEELKEYADEDVDADVWLDEDTDEQEEGGQVENGEEEEEEDSNDEEEDELLKELERIKREREEERRRKEEEERAKQESLELERAMRGNPLLNEMG
ncbi:uncharacterized protein Gasu_57140 [Galdieria sulphuraria]|uniref:Uncharacterized protein n=1 Tax=Galdieria sulphuraria TaxID=130081 RepID=M2VU38_GALSU|nr:uncharacterized protein Gasu_57140 [Galdieria sulphuraria]EME26711.1 hypothetical protein Gasu_57140 [Galdieria sulphuraria]|eukprot:XP_005703231.1 hypothetical protein Gasu_57140 [Galdieria sulphuraria]